MWSSARSEAALAAAFPVPIDVVPLKRARRFRLRFDAARGRLKLTCPARASRRTALAWAADQREWIAAQLARAGPSEPFAADAVFPLEGSDVRIAWSPSLPRAPRLDGATLICGGPESGLARRIEAYLKAHALAVMSRDAAEYAAAAGVNIAAVSVGDPSSRWGSCSSARRIRLSWRLILAPPHVRRYVVAHEVAHLVHLNHGAEFKALEARLYGPGLAAARSQLRRVGPRLRRIGRGA